MSTGDNDESGRSAFLDGSQVGDLGGSHTYRRYIRGFNFDMEGGGVRDNRYLAWTSHRSSQINRPRGWQSPSGGFSFWSHRNPETRGVVREPQPVVHDLPRKSVINCRRLQRHSCSQRSPKWDGRMRPWLGTTSEFIKSVRPSGDGAGGSTFYVEGPHGTILPQPVSLFDRDTRVLPIGRGDFPPAPLIRSHPYFVVLAARNREAPLLQT